ncbi:MAG: hypothetical protein V4475_11805 [Pseudomonadota bacterium]
MAGQQDNGDGDGHDDSGVRRDRKSGHRKDGKPYKEGNTRDDGTYDIGRARPPEAGKFREGDGRRRGRRKKGTANFETIFNAEANRPFEVRIDGKKQKLTAMESTVMFAFYMANKKQDMRAIALLMAHSSRLHDKAERKPVISRQTDAEILADWLSQLAAETEQPGAITDDHDITSSG